MGISSPQAKKTNLRGCFGRNHQSAHGCVEHTDGTHGRGADMDQHSRLLSHRVSPGHGQSTRNKARGAAFKSDGNQRRVVHQPEMERPEGAKADIKHCSRIDPEPQAPQRHRGVGVEALDDPPLYDIGKLGQRAGTFITGAYQSACPRGQSLEGSQRGKLRL